MDERLRRERGWIVDLVNVHEMAHTYFGNAVVMRDFAHAWLKESFAEFIEWEYLEQCGDQATAHFYILKELGVYVRECQESYMRPIVANHYQSSYQLFDMHLYPGGALRLRMLRFLLGPDVFWPAVSAYLTQFHGKVVETADFRRVLEQQSGLSLVRFFEQWLYSPGFLQLKASFSHDSPSAVLTITVEQTQQISGGGSGIGLFDSDLECLVEVSKDNWITTTIALSSQKPSSSATLRDVIARPLQIVFDPYLKLAHTMDFAPGLDLLHRTLMHGPSAAACMKAARALASLGTRGAVSALQEGLTTHPAWGVRLVVAEVLGELRRAASADILAAALCKEQDARVMVAVLSALAEHRVPSAEAAVLAFVSSMETGQQPYTVMAAALSALGAFRNDAHFSTLAHYAAHGTGPKPSSSCAAIAQDSNTSKLTTNSPSPPTPWIWVRRGAVQGLGQLHSARARAWLAAHLNRFPHHHTLRTAVVSALGTCCEWLSLGEKLAAADVLVPLCTTDRAACVRIAAGKALVSLSGSTHLHVLHQLRSTVCNQDQASVDQLIAQCGAKGSSGEEMERLRIRVEELALKIDKLDEAADGNGTGK